MVEGKKNLPGETEAMRLDDGFAILDELIGYLSQQEEWSHIQRHDALILKAEYKLYQWLEQIKSNLGVECLQGLEDAISVYNGTLNDAAILYGFRTAVKLFYAFGRPLEMSRFMLAHDEKKKVGVCYGQAD